MYWFNTPPASTTSSSVPFLDPKLNSGLNSITGDEGDAPWASTTGIFGVSSSFLFFSNKIRIKVNIPINNNDPKSNNHCPRVSPKKVLFPSFVTFKR